MKVSVKQVLSESISFYKTNFKNLIGISFVIFIFKVFLQAVTYVSMILKEHLLLLSLIQLVGTILIVASIVITPKIFIAMPILINSLLSGKKMTLSEAYRLTKGKYWLMMGCWAIICLWFIPCVILLRNKEVPFSGSIVSIYSALIQSVYYVLIPMVAIEPRTKRYLRRSARMIKGNYMAAFTLAFITTTLLAGTSGIFTYIFRGKITELFIIWIVWACIHFFTYPFAQTAGVIVYRQLEKEQGKTTERLTHGKNKAKKPKKHS